MEFKHFKLLFIISTCLYIISLYALDYHKEKVLKPSDISFGVTTATWTPITIITEFNEHGYVSGYFSIDKKSKFYFIDGSGTLTLCDKESCFIEIMFKDGKVQNTSIPE